MSDRSRCLLRFLGDKDRECPFNLWNEDLGRCECRYRDICSGDCILDLERGQVEPHAQGGIKSVIDYLLDTRPERSKAEISERLENARKTLETHPRSIHKRGYLEGWKDALEWVLNEWSASPESSSPRKSVSWEIPEELPDSFSKYDIVQITGFAGRTPRIYGYPIGPMTYIRTTSSGKVLRPPQVIISRTGATLSRPDLVLSYGEYIRDIEGEKIRRRSR